MKTSKRILTAVTAVAMLAVGITGFAVAQEPSSEKEEVVYANADSNGNISGIYVVNIFSGGEIVDYGDYKEVKVLNTTDEIRQQGDQITLSSDADRVYYEGILDRHDLPWNIQIRYTLNGEAITPENLGGSSGKLGIDLSFRQNPNCDSSFFDRFALQTTMTLDTNRCSKITAEGATIANVGENKQLSYIILPGREKDFHISADVTDFAMDSININGIRMDLSVDIDNGDLLDEVSQIENAAVALDDGAAALNDGSTALYDGAKELSTGAYRIAAGSSTLSAGIDAFCAGLADAQQGLALLNSKSSAMTEGSKEVKTALNTIDKQLSSLSTSAEEVKELLKASSEINQSLSALSGSLGSLTDSIGSSGMDSAIQMNQNDIATLDQDITTLSSLLRELQSYETVIRTAGKGDVYDSCCAEINGILKDLSAVKATLGSNVGTLQTTKGNLSALHQQANAITDKATVLSEEYQVFNTKITELATTLTEMLQQMDTLSQAISLLCSEYDTLDSGIRDYTDGVAQIVVGFEEASESITLLTNGSKELALYLNALCNGTDSLASGAETLSSGATELFNGTTAFRNATTGMDEKVEAKIDDMIASLTGGDGKTKSFVSDKNTRVTAVQFVISTDPIKGEDEE